MYAAFELEPDAKFEAVELPTEYTNMRIPKEIAIHTQSSTLHSNHRNQESSDLNEQQFNVKDRLAGWFKINTLGVQAYLVNCAE